MHFDAFAIPNDPYSAGPEHRWGWQYKNASTYPLWYFNPQGACRCIRLYVALGPDLARASGTLATLQLTYII